ncbi:hypothetical protein A3C09_04500 [Candidatus Uhrbacteria bacterium RIFCSPHIGHO2_02_FULL_47_44]|uniref:Transcription regulator TrmB N-terminal domain-containing protein n=1 Tax=Candidatus Uhrbacteria bacterium RIFCSPLOWO2_02_FULL_48_18 TaxID=1802408 RepID=A0A1F7VCA7_9BACT|nr:MAG: hypothetical protein A2839_03820 [Candidatus Uhrbacteria bacterium RIFCSPHIGHO2_01_FULL_47_10]OGL70164.1 MAG: hypothetical protein A3C09_04500 [Candidatus Uhrbacteria bacterium RIFCSPHIGHO2_02_FULL_47_44]OGL77826.1 MAG: hypothetical protein A3E97_02600 [Candidatus Uhrbacteria bacterium RIFCSPHIGHO2_12_FULL_47_12]OGL80645.1 MAG: hypothetical protein A3B20_04595 [Candidatus Uhrbacteria bacterium RIFCSPLOWO2_01_FULL_47_17]OGL88172.1 MAG: hypothetical protein A3I41_00385 [Candidatus Uhrbact
MKNPESFLQSLGLTQTESTVYLAGLSHNGTNAQALAKQTGIKRPTVYYALETLMQKGLVTKKGVGNRRVYSMTSPENLKTFVDAQISEMQTKKQSLDGFVETLLKQQGVVTPTSSVSHYEGIEGVKLVVEEALYCKSRHWDILAPKKNFFSEFDAEYAKYYLDARKRRRITSRSLWEKVGGKSSVSREVIAERQPRYLPEVMSGRFQSVMILFDDRVLFISSYKSLSAILIQSDEMHQFLLAMFDGLWAGAEKIG